MATLIISVLKHQKRKDGKYPVSIRLTHKRNSAYINTKLYVTDKQLDKKGNLKDTFLLRELNNRLAVYEEKKAALSFKLEAYSAKELAEYLVRATERNSGAGIDFLNFATEHKKNLIDKGKKRTAEIVQTTINSLKDFTNSDVIFFSEITVAFLQKYEKWLTIEKQKPVKGRGASLYMGQIKMLFNKAVNLYNDEDKGEVVITNYPFKRYKIPTAPTPEKRARSVEEFRAIINYQPIGKRDEFARDVFILSFCLIGMNAADLFTCPKPIDGRITYFRKKTTARRVDKAEFSVKLMPEITELVNKYKDETDSDHAFRFYKMYSSIQNMNRALREGLNILSGKLGISHLTFYAARHSWATIAVNDCKISLYDVHEALNHVNPQMKITELYVIKDWSRIDRTNRRVLDFVFENKLP